MDITIIYPIWIFNVPLQAMLIVVGAIFATLPGTKEDTPDKVAIGSVVAGLIPVSIAEFGC